MTAALERRPYFEGSGTVPRPLTTPLPTKRVSLVTLSPPGRRSTASPVKIDTPSCACSPDGFHETNEARSATAAALAATPIEVLPVTVQAFNSRVEPVVASAPIPKLPRSSARVPSMLESVSVAWVSGSKVTTPVSWLPMNALRRAVKVY